MTCARIRKQILQSDVAQLPSGVLDHARQCPRCGLVLQRTRTVSGLIHLKAYEQPAPGAEGRCLAEVRDRIAVSQSWQQQGSRAEGAGLGLGWRFSFAAAFVVLIGLNMATSSRLPLVQPMAGQTESAADQEFVRAITNRMDTRSPVLQNLPRVGEVGGVFHQPSTTRSQHPYFSQPRVSKPGTYYYNAGYQER